MRIYCCSAKAAGTASLLALTLTFLPIANAQPSQQHAQATQASSPAQNADQTELTKRILAAGKIRETGDPDAIAHANRLLIASALQAMARLRLAESSPAQSAELFRTSLQFEDVPSVHLELARTSLLAGQPDQAVLEAQKVIAAEPDNAEAYVLLGRALSGKQEYVKAAEAMSRAEQIHPSIEILYSEAICWLSTNNAEGSQKANAVFAEMKAMAGDSGSLHVLMGRAYRDASMMQDAIREFKRAIELDTTTPHAHYFLGLAYLAMNDWKPLPQVQAEFEKEVHYHPKDFLANYMLGFLASANRQYPVAEKYLKIAAELNPTSPDPPLYLGLNAFAQENYPYAEQQLRKAVELTGTDESRANYQIRRAYVDLARILARDGNEKESDVFVAKARDLENKVMTDTQQQTTAILMSEGANISAVAGLVPLDKQQENESAPIGTGDVSITAPVNATALNRANLTASQLATAQKEEKLLRPILGQSYSDLATAEAIQHDYASALTHYQAAEEWAPDVPDLGKNLGQAAFRDNNYPEAIRGLAEAVKQNPDSPALRAMLGMAYFEIKRYGDAATAFYPLGEAGMHDSAVGYAWAASLAKAGDLKHATEVLEAYQSNAGLSNEGLLLIGQLWTEIGDYDRAVTTFRQILASDPSLPKVHYNIALADIHAEKWEGAETELNAELANSPGDPDTMFNLGFVDLQESKNDDAMKLFEQVIAQHPDYANAQYELGKLLLDKGQAQDAVPHLEAAERVSPDKDYIHYQLQAAYRKLSRTADADRELAVYQQLKAKSRAEAQAQIEQQSQQKP